MLELRRCKFGHSFDPSISPECPECAAMEGHTIPLVSVDIGGYQQNFADFGSDDNGKTIPIQRSTLPVNPRNASWANAEDYQTAGYSSECYDPTMPLNVPKDTVTRPVTGWLVCVEGPEKGRDFRLHSDMNYIGRARNNDVVLAGDASVSRERHAMVAYDSRDKLFFFAPANGSSLVRQNGRPVLSTVELKAGDRLEIGEGTYMFIPLCGENFEW